MRRLAVRVSRAIVGRRNGDAEIAEEVRQHLERRADDLVRAGVAVDEARRRARLEFGSVEAYKEQVRDVLGPSRLIAATAQTGRDFKYAARRLARAPVFTIFAVVSLAVGLGVTTAFYALMHNVLWPTAGLAESSRLVQLLGQYVVGDSYIVYGTRAGLPRGDLDDFRETQTSLASVAAWTTFEQPFIARDVAERFIGEAVTGNAFSTLGVTVSLGRALTDSDDTPNAVPVVVLAHGFWATHFRKDPSVVGQVARMGILDVRIVGVADPKFSTMGSPDLEGPRGWIPLEVLRRFPGEMPEALDRSSHVGYSRLVVLGRLAPGRTIEQANAEARAISGNLDRAYPQSLKGRGVPRNWRVEPITKTLRGSLVEAWSLVALIGLLLGVACTNLANLVLARGSAHQHEFAVRRALGASWWRLVREQCAESALLGVAAGILALGIARVLLIAGAAQVPPGLRFSLPMELTPDMLLAAGVALLVSVAVFGLWPAVQLTRQEVRSALGADGGTGGAIRWRTRRWLIVSQVAIAAAFVTIAATCVRSLVTAVNTNDSIIDVHRLATADLSFSGTGWDEGRIRVALQRIGSVLRSYSGIQAFALATNVPILTVSPARVWPAEAPASADADRPRAMFIAGTPELFSVLGLPVVRGRTFTEHDTEGSPPVAVLSETTAREVFGGENAIGRAVTYRNFSSPMETFPATVVGVVADAIVDPRGTNDLRSRTLYVPLAQRIPRSITILTRTPGDPAVVLEPLRSLIRQADPALVPGRATTGTFAYDSVHWTLRLFAIVGVSLGAIALLLPMTGLFGVLGHLVSRRTREMGIRLALGATGSQLRRMVLTDGLLPVAYGLAIGCLVGVLVRFGLNPLARLPASWLDGVALLVVGTSFSLAGLVACYLPAARASNLAPGVALREL